MNQMNVWGMTDIGLVRKENQDAYVTAQHTASGRTVGVVCDGMGGARVSEKHCGFVINAGDATACDVMKLMRQIQETVWEKFRLRLEPEVRFLGDFNGGCGEC